MSVSILPRKYHRKAGSKLNPVQLRGFGGGWNAIDDDISMSPKYLVTQKNMHRTASGASELRFGQKWLADVKAVVNGDIIDHSYFANNVIAVMSSGDIAAVNAAGVASAIWNNAIAAALPGAPTGWTAAVERGSFVPFRDALVIHNGKDKPVSISVALATTYLQDLATGSNTNVPIGKYGCVVGNYHVVAGIAAAPTVVYIASKATAGTFPGDPAPNDAISFDVGAYAPAGATEIRGVAGFRQFLIVFFLTQAAIFTLGTYDDTGNHTPIPFDTLPRFGLVGHRCLVQLEKDMFIADIGGAGTATRNLFSGLIDTDRLSDVIGPEYQQTVGGFDDATLLLDAFSVYDRLGNRVLFFTPDGRVFVYSENAKLRYKAWSEYEYNSPFTSACTTILGRVILAKGTRLYTLGNVAFDEKYTADLIDDKDADWLNSTAYVIGDIICDLSVDTCYTCSVNHTSPATGTFADSRTTNPTYWTEYLGVGIPFEMELPWVVGKDPMQTKQNRFLGVLSKGDCPFTLEAYVDGLYKDVDGTIIYDPALSMDFVGNETPGFGNMDDQPFGGGRRSGDPRLWAFPVKFKSIKFRIIGNTAARTLQVIGITSLFSRGNYKRT